jgi:hypothetical protein
VTFLRCYNRHRFFCSGRRGQPFVAVSFARLCYFLAAV